MRASGLIDRSHLGPNSFGVVGPTRAENRHSQRLMQSHDPYAQAPGMSRRAAAPDASASSVCPETEADPRDRKVTLEGGGSLRRNP